MGRQFVKAKWSARVFTYPPPGEVKFDPENYAVVGILSNPVGILGSLGLGGLLGLLGEGPRQPRPPCPYCGR
jgi:hypothetical protein